MFLLALFNNKIFLTFGFCLILAISQVQAAVVTDTRSGGGMADNAGLASLSWNQTVNNGANRALFVGVSTATTTLPASLPTNRVQSVTYNGVALTRIGTIVSANSLNSSELFSLVNPTVGTANVVVTFSSTVAAIPLLFVNQAAGNSISLFNVSQTTPNGAFISATGTNNSLTVNVSGSVSGDLIFDNLVASPNALNFVEGSGQTVCTDIMDETTCTRGRRIFGYDLGASSVKLGALPSVTMSWTMTNSDSWALGAVVVRQNVSTAANTSISGKITIKGNQPLKNVSIALQNLQTGEFFKTTTDERGFYIFEELELTNLYRVDVFSNFYNFSPTSRIVNLTEQVDELNFFASPRNRKERFFR